MTMDPIERLKDIATYYPDADNLPPAIAREVEQLRKEIEARESAVVDKVAAAKAEADRTAALLEAAFALAAAAKAESDRLTAEQANATQPV
jgi:hypothetical protein